MIRILPILLISLTLALGCASDGSDPMGPAGTTDLTGVSLPTAHGRPLTRLPILGLEGDPWEFQVEVVDADGTVRSGAPVFLKEDGTYEFPVPFHPDDPAEGGVAQLRVTRGEAASELLDFTVDPLPAATGGLSGAVTEMRSNLALRAGLLDVTVGELASASWESLDPVHVPLKAMWSFLDDPDNPNRLSELAAGRAPLLGEGPVDVDLLDRIVDLIDVSGFMTAENQELAALGSPPGKTVVDIGSAEQLDWYMGLARSSAFRLEEGSAVNQLNQDLGLAMTALGIIPHPAAQLTAAGVGALQYAYTTARQAMASLLPSAFSNMEFELSHDFFNEDSEEIGEWSKVDVWAVSQGWNADQAAVDGLLTLASLGRAHRDWMNRFDDITGTAWAENVRNFIVDNVLRMLNAIGQNGILQFEPQTFGPIDVTDGAWSYGVVLTDKIAITSHQSYQPNAVGTDQLEIRTLDGKFGGQSIELSKPVEVRQIRVEVTPQITQLDNAGEVVTLQATVHNADDKGLQWTVAPATWEIEPDGVGTGTEVGSIRTPVNQDLYNFTVTVVSTSSTGLRASSSDERSGSGQIRLAQKSIVIDPGYICIGNDERTTFTAEVTGVEDTRVTWSKLEGWGSINATTGEYHAPDVGSGEAIIVATSVEDPELTGWATVSFGACRCWWEGSVAGDAFWTGGSDQAGFIRSEFGEEFSGLTFIFGNPNAPGEEIDAGIFSFGVWDLGPGTYPYTGDLGTYRISGDFLLGSRAWVAGQVDEDPDDPGPVLTMTVTEHTDSLVAGTIQGQMMRETADGSRFLISVNLSFSAGPALSPSSCYD